MKNKDPETLIELLRVMRFIRRVEEEIAHRYGEGKMRCPTHLSIGQEAVAAGTCLALARGDQVVSTHRGHAHYLAKGGDLKALIAELYGKATGCSSGRGGSMHLTDLSVGFIASTAILGNSIPVGVGLGLADALRRNRNVSCVFFGDATVEEGVFSESLSFAALKALPVLFVCENNLYSVYSPLAVRQPANREIWKFAGAHGLPAEHGDGNDAIEVYEKASSALDHVRSGRGPYFLEFATYRWREHCGPNYDNDLGYRSTEEFEIWRKRDPIPRLASHLLEVGFLDQTSLNALDAAILNDVEAAFRFAEESPFPEADETCKHLFA